MKKNILAVIFVFCISQVFAEDKIYTKPFSNKAVDGYDVVSYFSGKPVKGLRKYKTKFDDAVWYFANEENLKKFKKDPDKYAPQYGGYCAWAAAHGTLAKTDPLVWDIVKGKLYLNYDKSIQELWQPRRFELIPVADQEFPDLIEE